MRFYENSYPTLENCLSQAVSLTNFDILDMALDLIEKKRFHLVTDLVEILKFLE